MSIIALSDLSYQAKGNTILKNINLKVEQQTIYGLVGRNGAGKTTLIKAILGIIIPQKGSAKLFDKKIDSSSLNKVGSLIENASLYEHLTAYQHLTIYQLIYKLPKSAIDEVLALVNLEKEAHTIL